jgi:hypothetical protein
VLLVAVVLGFGGASARSGQFPDIAQIGPVVSKGRIQDNSRSAVVAALVEAGPSAIPFLVSKLEDNTEVKGHVFDYWPRVAVGDVALVLLVDLFTTPDGATTIPGLTWDDLLGRSSKDVAAWDVLADFIKQNGRAGLRRKVVGILNADKVRYSWDPSRLCFRPAVANR